MSTCSILEHIGQVKYLPIDVHATPNYHDRFLIIDDTVYHIGASLKDLGKKLFAFSELEVPVEKLELEGVK